MTEEGFKRKLTAVLSADVEGYSRLMGEDEEATVRTLNTYREVISTLIQQHRGRVIDTTGDNLLAEFSSVVDALRCALDIQQEIKARNAELPENRRMEFRIGINLGDVIEEGDRIYGNGVNVAARVESLADGGGITISGTAYDQVKNKLPLTYEYQGEQSVKNITEPVRVYRVLMEPEAAGKVIGEERAKRRRWAALAVVVALILVVGALTIRHYYLRPALVEPASVERMAFPLPEKPSIAVLPFDNLSGDQNQEYLADGITENIISTLSKIPEMFVIARNSTFTYKGKPVKVQQVSEELGVRHVLEGSVQKAGERLRVTAQLVDAITGHHLWSEQYDRDIKELFALQDEITYKIVVALQVKLTEGEQARVRHRSTSNLKAWGYAVRGYSLFERYNKEDNAKARELCEEAIKLDPEYAWAWTWLAWTHWIDARFGFSESRAESFKRAVEIARKAVALDESDPDIHALLGSVHLFQRQYEKAITEGERAVALGPNNAEVHNLLAQIKYYVGRFEEAITLSKKAMRLSPYYQSWYLVFLAHSYRMVSRYDEALATFMQLLDRCRKGECPPWWAHIGLAEVYIELGREEEARAQSTELLKVRPDFSLEYFRKAVFFKDTAHLERRLSTLRKAGLPDKPPLPLPDKPSIAILPFVNMSDDPKQEYFSDGITEEIITALSKVPKLFVIARTSSFKYKGKDMDVKQVGRELGVRYVLEGSVRKAGDRVRITAQLVDAKTGHHLWSERYDRELKDIFALQDEITREILIATRVSLTEGEQARVWSKRKRSSDIKAYEKVLQARSQFFRMNPEGNAMARQRAEEAIEIDPNFAAPYIYLAFTHLLDITWGISKSPRKSLQLAEKFVQKAISLDDSHPIAIITLGQISLYKRQHEKAITEGQRALALDPNGAEVHNHLGFFLHMAGRSEEAIPLYEKAIRLNPYPPSFYYQRLGGAYAATGRYEEAVAACKKALKRQANDLAALIVLAIVYSLQGREEEARAYASKVLRIMPNFSAERFAKKLPYENQARTKLLIENLRKAGLK